MEPTLSQNQDCVKTFSGQHSQPPDSPLPCWPQALSELDDIEAFVFDLPVHRDRPTSPETEWSQPSPDVDADVAWPGLTDWSCLSSESDWLTDSPPRSLSPASPESCRFWSQAGPSSLPRGTPSSPPPAPHCPDQSPALPSRGGRRRQSRWRCSGRQRESASEREKLRMRGLASALHNLRMYLPPSVVPPDQNLTKLQTLQLTVRYIAHLTKLLGSGQGHVDDREASLLGVSGEEGLHQRASSSLPTERRVLSHHGQPLTLSPLQKIGCEMEATSSWTLTPSSYPAQTSSSYPAHASSLPAQTPSSYPAQTNSFPAQDPSSYPAQTSSFPAHTNLFPGQTSSFPTHTSSLQAHTSSFLAQTPSSYPTQISSFPAHTSSFPAQTTNSYAAQTGNSYPAQTPSSYPAQNPSLFPVQTSSFPAQTSSFPAQTSSFPAQTSSFPALTGRSGTCALALSVTPSLCVDNHRPFYCLT